MTIGPVNVRIIRFGGSSVQIDCIGHDADRVVDFLFKDLPESEGPAPHITLRVHAQPGGAKLTLHCGERSHYRGDCLAGLASSLLGQTIYHLSDKSQGGLLFHAAAVSWKGRCVVLPGKTGAGKTTLAAWLVRKGLGYLTDELVYVPFGLANIQPFVRPLNIKPSAQSALRSSRILDFESLEPQILGGRDVTLVSAVALDSPVAPARPGLGVIAFPRYQTRSRFSAERLSKAQAGMGLMGCLINARNLPDHGFTEVTRLARMAPAFRVSYGDFDQLEDWVGCLKAELEAL